MLSTTNSMRNITATNWKNLEGEIRQGQSATNESSVSVTQRRAELDERCKMNRYNLSKFHTDNLKDRSTPSPLDERRTPVKRPPQSLRTTFAIESSKVVNKPRAKGLRSQPTENLRSQ